jgi:hypothetical protein
VRPQGGYSMGQREGNEEDLWVTDMILPFSLTEQGGEDWQV